MGFHLATEEELPDLWMVVKIFPLWSTLLVELEPLDPTKRSPRELVLPLSEHRWLLLPKHSFPIYVAEENVFQCQVIADAIYVHNDSLSKGSHSSCYLEDAA